MTEQEKINSEVQMKLALQDAKFNALSDKIDLVVNEMRESRARQDEDMREIRQSLNSNVRNMFITVIIGICAMVVAVLMK